MEELFEANDDYMVSTFAPSLFLIGSNGGDTAYGLYKNSGEFIEVPFIGLSNDTFTVISKDFYNFLVHISRE
ncbi:hypothetical protein [Chitinophaga skermanii]|uniref:hypothetical protein n=1 Tax=Chitinophaga skermanii TaxID=331697 RepID=UPI0011E60327|nr:hypothetical protein [Chitinophaga skermanii]